MQEANSNEYRTTSSQSLSPNSTIMLKENVHSSKQHEPKASATSNESIEKEGKIISSSRSRSKTSHSSSKNIQLRDSDTDIGRYVLKRVLAFAKYSELERVRTPRPIAWKDVAGHRVWIGRGAFSDVYRVQLLVSVTDHDNDSATLSTNNNNNKEVYYALKRLNSVMPIHAKKFRTGASDLALEASLLECLDHPNIIRLYGIKSDDLVESMNHRDYFLILDFLALTLHDQLKVWRKENSGFVAKLNKRAGRRRLMHRLEHTALGVARGMEYLHSKVRTYGHLMYFPTHIALAHNCSQPYLFSSRTLSFGISNQTMSALILMATSKFSILGWRGIWALLVEAEKCWVSLAHRGIWPMKSEKESNMA